MHVVCEPAASGTRFERSEPTIVGFSANTKGAYNVLVDVESKGRGTLQTYEYSQVFIIINCWKNVFYN